MIEKTSEQTKQAILRKTPFAHGTRPSDDGMPAAQVKKMFYTALVDEDNSLLAEMERMRVEANADIAAKMDADKICDRIEEHLDSHHFPSTLGLTRYLDGVGNVLRLYYTDLEVPPAAWEALTTPVGTYGYQATVPLEGVTARMIPDLCFAPSDAVRSQLATFCRLVDGGVVVYATEALSDVVTIECLMCSVPTYFTLMCDVTNADVVVRDDLGKAYASGDFVAVGTHLTIHVNAVEGYTLTHYFVNGVQHPIAAVAEVTVEGTVAVSAAGTEVTI